MMARRTGDFPKYPAWQRCLLIVGLSAALWGAIILAMEVL